MPNCTIWIRIRHTEVPPTFLASGGSLGEGDGAIVALLDEPGDVL